MHIVYWAHSYRDDDAAINEHFGVLIEQAEQMIINLDPPSPSVNEFKLDQNLRSCDGMVEARIRRQVRLAKDQQSVQALAAHGADQAFRVTILPRRSRRIGRHAAKDLRQ